MIDLISYGGGNLGSMTRCLGRLEVEYRLIQRASDLGGERPVILPGVGSFGAVMKGLAAAGLDRRLGQVLSAGTPFLGICVGLQVLLEESTESPGVPGLGLIPGKVVRFQQGKVPQVGWNRVVPRSGSDLEPGYAYFVNSYHARVTEEAMVAYTADYFGPFCAAVQTGNLTAYQFHPERSGEFGHGLVRRWLDAL